MNARAVRGKFSQPSQLRAPSLFFEGPTFDKFTPDMIAETRRVGNANGSWRRNFQFGLNNVFHPIALAGRDIAGKRISRQGRDGDVMCAADTTLQHPTAPSGNVLGEAVRLHGTRAGMTANATELNIY